MRDALSRLSGSDWLLMAVAVLTVAGGSFGYFFFEKPGADQAVLAATTLSSTAPAPAGAVEMPISPTRPSKEEETLAVIASHRERVEQDPKSEESPAYICAMGNLYRQKLLDYDEAIQCYLWVLNDYPDWSGILRVYLNLAACYEQQGRIGDAEGVYKQMMQKYPEGSTEYQFAKAELGR